MKLLERFRREGWSADFCSLQHGPATGGRSGFRHVNNSPSRPAALLLLALIFAFAAALFADDSSAQFSKAGRGLGYKNDIIPQVPWSIHIIKIERGRDDLELVTTLGRGAYFGLSPLSFQIRSVPPDLGKPIAAINGDFYRTEHDNFAGDPRGLQILRGELVSAPSGRTCFWMDTNGNPQIGDVVPQFTVTWPNGVTTRFGLNEECSGDEAVLYTPVMGRSTRTDDNTELVLERDAENPWLPLRAGQSYSARVREVREGGNAPLKRDVMVLSLGQGLQPRPPKARAGMVLKISTATTPDLQGVKMAIGGGPALVKGGKQQSAVANKSRDRHPRSAIGWNDKHIFLVEVDGRQPGLSMGMSLPELAAYMVRLGCEGAMNLDGGASAEVWLDGQVMNSPCHGGERSTANGIVLLQKNKAEKP